MTLRKTRNETPEQYYARLKNAKMQTYAAGQSLANLRHLVEGGMSVRERDVKRMTPLHWANDLKVAKALLSDKYGKPAKVGYENIQGDTPLHTVRDPEIIAYLITNGGDPNAVNRLGWPAWARATSAEAAQAFIAGGAKYDAEMKHGELAVEHFYRELDTGFRERLMKADAGDNSAARSAVKAILEGIRAAKGAYIRAYHKQHARPNAKPSGSRRRLGKKAE